MALDVEKLRLLQATAEQMTARSAADLNLVLYEAGLGELPSHWYGDEYNGPPDDEDRRRLAQGILRDLPSVRIREIATALQQLFDASAAPIIPFEPKPVRLFASHLASQKKLVKAVADALEIFSVSLFVAHVDIAIDDEWHAAIESNLQTVDAGVVFLHPKFNESAWCDQEVGWLLGRGVPAFTLKFAHQDPYGPLGKKQAQVIEATATASTIADYIVRWISTKPALQGRLNASLVEALQRTYRFADTDRVWSYLQKAKDLTIEQVGAVASAVRDNDQVYGATCRVPENHGQWYPEVILPWLFQQPGCEENKGLIYEVAELRKVKGIKENFSTTVPSMNGWASTPNSDPPPPLLSEKDSVSQFKYFSDRTNGPTPRTADELPQPTARAVFTAITSRAKNNWFAKQFPESCPDGRGVIGTDHNDLWDTAAGFVPKFTGQVRGSWDELGLPDEVLFDLVEFAAQRVHEPKEDGWHSFFGHYELGFDRAAGVEVVGSPGGGVR